MKRVFLIGTVHVQSGLASIEAMFATLKRLRPEVVFLEYPVASNLEEIISRSSGKLEFDALALYEMNHEVKIVPVDLPTPEPEFFHQNQYLLRRIERASQEYCRLLDWHSQSVRNCGLGYLNSTRCETVWSEIYREMEQRPIPCKTETRWHFLIHGIK
jgi:hypothetical protein